MIPRVFTKPNLASFLKSTYIVIVAIVVIVKLYSLVLMIFSPMHKPCFSDFDFAQGLEVWLGRWQAEISAR